MKKLELSRDSILKAIADGANSMTRIAHAHNYVGSVSSGTTKKIRELVPEVAARLDGTYVEPVVKPVKSAKPVVQVAQRKGVYSGLYGAVFARAVAAGEVPVKEFIGKAATEIAADADPAVAKAVGKIKARHPDADMVEQVKKAITFAVGVIRAPKHQSNMGRSKDASEKRGSMLIVPVEG